MDHNIFLSHVGIGDWIGIETAAELDIKLVVIEA
jgi:hypothetical protein